MLLHGFTDTWRTWELVLPALEERLRAVRGLGVKDAGLLDNEQYELGTRWAVYSGVFRTDTDPLQLYISIAALGYFYVSNDAGGTWQHPSAAMQRLSELHNVATRTWDRPAAAGASLSRSLSATTLLITVCTSNTSPSQPSARNFFISSTAGL